MFPVNALRSTSAPWHYFRKFSVKVHWWPTLQNPWEEGLQNPHGQTNFPKVPYEISRSDFEWVKKVLPNRLVPPAPDTKEPTPSGWIPPNPERYAKYPYFVRRSKNHMLPVYFKEKQRKLAERTHGVRQLTVIRHIDGDMWALAEDLRQLLEPKCDGGLFLCQVDEATRQIRIEGIYLEEVAKFLIEKGF